jgi:mannose-6-phosphate isomerase-like protein (cupin superfamily)
MSAVIEAGWSIEAMSARVVRYSDLKPCYNAFIDTRTPGSEAKENFTIIGPGVSENPEQFVHIAEPHGFNIGGARQPPACVNSQHSHDTAEVFIAHSGQWRFDLGEKGEDASVFLGPGDVISLPTQMFRGFTNVGDDVGYLFAILGNDNPGRVLWAPDVFELAKQHGLVLLETGQLIDTVAGQTVPDNVAPMPPTSAEQVARLQRAAPENAHKLVWKAESAASNRTAIIGPDGPLNWDHGFTVSRHLLTAGDAALARKPQTPEVVFVQSGQVDVMWEQERLTLGKGDTMTLPRSLSISLQARSHAVLFLIEGSQH